MKAESGDLGAWDARTFYSEEQIERYVADLVDGRRTFTEEIAEQGMRKDIRKLASEELDAMDVRSRRKVEPWAPPEEREQTGAGGRGRPPHEDPRSRFISPWEPRRPSVSHFPGPSSARSKR